MEAEAFNLQQNPQQNLEQQHHDLSVNNPSVTPPSGGEQEHQNNPPFVLWHNTPSQSVNRSNNMRGGTSSFFRNSQNAPSSMAPNSLHPSSIQPSTTQRIPTFSLHNNRDNGGGDEREEDEDEEEEENGDVEEDEDENQPEGGEHGPLQQVEQINEPEAQGEAQEDGSFSESPPRSRRTMQPTTSRISQPFSTTNLRLRPSMSRPQSQSPLPPPCIHPSSPPPPSHLSRQNSAKTTTKIPASAPSTQSPHSYHPSLSSRPTKSYSSRANRRTLQCTHSQPYYYHQPPSQSRNVTASLEDGQGEGDGEDHENYGMISISKLESTFAEWNSLVPSYRRWVSDVKKYTSDLYDQLEQEKETVARISIEADGLKENLDQSNQKNAELSDSYDSSVAEVGRLKRRVQELENNLTETTTKNEIEKKNLSESIKCLQTEIGKAEARDSENARSIASGEMERDSLKKDLSTLQQNNSEIKKRFLTNVKEHEESLLQITTLTAEKTKLENDHNSLTENFKLLSIKYDKVNEEVKQLQVDKTEMASNIIKLNDTVDAGRKQYMDTQKEKEFILENVRNTLKTIFESYNVMEKADNNDFVRGLDEVMSDNVVRRLLFDSTTVSAHNVSMKDCLSKPFTRDTVESALLKTNLVVSGIFSRVGTQRRELTDFIKSLLSSLHAKVSQICTIFSTTTNAPFHLSTYHGHQQQVLTFVTNIMTPAIRACEEVQTQRRESVGTDSKLLMANEKIEELKKNKVELECTLQEVRKEQKHMEMENEKKKTLVCDLKKMEKKMEILEDEKSEVEKALTMAEREMVELRKSSRKAENESMVSGQRVKELEQHLKEVMEVAHLQKAQSEEGHKKRELELQQKYLDVTTQLQQHQQKHQQEQNQQSQSNGEPGQGHVRRGTVKFGRGMMMVPLGSQHKTARKQDDTSGDGENEVMKDEITELDEGGFKTKEESNGGMGRGRKLGKKKRSIFQNKETGHVQKRAKVHH